MASQNNWSEENARKSQMFDDMTKYYMSMISYRDGLLAHHTAGLKEVVLTGIDKRYKTIAGKSILCETEKSYVAYAKLTEDDIKDIRSEVERLNHEIEALSKMFNTQKQINEDRNSDKG